MPFLRQSGGAPGPNNPEAAQSTASEVFVVPETGQIFEEYEKYVETLALKNQAVWSCKYTGRNGLLFGEALESERRAQAMLDAFPECWKRPILHHVQHSSPAAPGPLSML